MMGSDRDVGMLVAEFRGERTQQSVADAMRERGWPWSQATVWSVEKGERPLKLREAAVLASVLGITVEALVREDAELVLLSNRLISVTKKIVGLRQEINGLRQELAHLEVQLENAEQDRLTLQQSLRAGQQATLESRPETTASDESA